MFWVAYVVMLLFFSGAYIVLFSVYVVAYIVVFSVACVCVCGALFVPSRVELQTLYII